MGPTVEKLIAMAKDGQPGELGNALLDLLLRQRHGALEAVEAAMPELVVAAFQIPSSLQYELCNTEQEPSRLTQQMILAYALGANYRHLPSPHEGRYFEFLYLGSYLRTHILDAELHRLGALRTEFDSTERRLQHSKLESTAIRAALAASHQETEARDGWCDDQKNADVLAGLHHCGQDNFRFPKFIGKQCPSCGGSDIAYVGYEQAKRPSSFGEVLDNQQLTKRISSLVNAGDFSGLGNAILRFLIEPTYCGKEAYSYLKSAANSAAAARFGIRQDVTLPSYYIDRVLPYESQSNWRAGVFTELIVLAITLDASWRMVPEPHASFLPFYDLMALRQKELLQAMAEKEPGTTRRFTLADI